MISISVVIATYNRAQLLRTTIEQLSHQQYAPGDEVIVVDNASIDATARVLADAAKHFPVPLRWLHECAPGKGPALNAGIATARGTVLALTDDDVLVAEDWIAKIRDIFGDPSVALVGGRVDPLWQSPPPGWLRVPPDSPYGAMTSPLALQHYGDIHELGSRTAIGANLAIRREVLDALGGFKPELARRAGSLFGVEDQEICRRAQGAGYRCRYCSDLRVRHWVPAERMRLSYFSRWFFWSGYANALLGTDDPKDADGQRRPLSGYYFRRLVTACTAAVGHSLKGHSGDATEMAMEAAYALGYIVQRASWGFRNWPRTTAACIIALIALSPPGGLVGASDGKLRRAGSVGALRKGRRPEDSAASLKWRLAKTLPAKEVPRISGASTCVPGPAHPIGNDLRLDRTVAARRPSAGAGCRCVSRGEVAKVAGAPIRGQDG